MGNYPTSAEYFRGVLATSQPVPVSMDPAMIRRGRRIGRFGARTMWKHDGNIFLVGGRGVWQVPDGRGTSETE